MLKTLSLNQIKLVHINKASVCFMFNDSYGTYFITTKNFNKLLRGDTIQYVIVDKEHQGLVLQWIAIPSIF
jgi:hypothetical protein